MDCLYDLIFLPAAVKKGYLKYSQLLDLIETESLVHMYISAKLVITLDILAVF